jgi:uncharacterized protein YjiS (DUF1127 family)
MDMMLILNLFLSAGRTIAEWRRRERAYAELMALDDRSLADIGIHRSQILALVDGSGREPRAEPAPSFWAAQATLSGLRRHPL